MPGALEYLAGSSVRPATLAALRGHGRLSLRDLDDRVSASRRTIKRTLNAMESHGWIQPADGAYQLTVLGACILSAYEEFRDRERLAERVRPFLEHTPAVALDADFDLETLADATVVTSDSGPTAFVDHLLEIRSDVSRLREYAPFLMLDSVRQLAERVESGLPAPDVTLVLQTDAPPRSSPEYAERVETLLDAESVDVRLYPDGPMIGLGVADSSGFLAAADGDGIPNILLAGDDPELVAWIERALDDYLAAAEPLSPE
jgi:predicted transcriptional regulator